MIVLGHPELPGRDDLGHDPAVPLPRALDALLDALGHLPLLVVVVEDGRAVLGADVVVLAVQRRRVVHAEEVAEQVLVAEPRGVEHHLDGFCVSRVAAADVPVRRVLRRASRVPDPRLEHAGDLSQDILHTPEAAARQSRDGAAGGHLRIVLVLLEERQVLAVALRLELLDRDEAERRRVDAVAQPRRRRPVVEDVTQVGVAVLGAHLGPRREQLAILATDDVFVLERPREARPAGARVELVEGAEERLARGDVDVDARLLVVPEGVAEGRLGRLVLSDFVLLLGECLVELGVVRLGVGLHLWVSGRARLGGGGRRREERQAPDEHEESRASVHVSVAWMVLPPPTFPCPRGHVNGPEG